MVSLYTGFHSKYTWMHQTENRDYIHTSPTNSVVHCTKCGLYVQQKRPRQMTCTRKHFVLCACKAKENTLAAFSYQTFQQK